MRRKMFGTYDNGGMVSGGTGIEEDFIPVDQSSPNVRTPEVFGQSLPSANIKKKTMGDIFASPEEIEPKDFAAQGAAKKRMKGFGKDVPMRPVTGVGGGQAQAQPGGQEDVSLGNRWLGELWQGLTAGEDIGGFGSAMGYQGGGSVDSGMEVYSQTMRNLDSGLGFAHGGVIPQRGPEAWGGPSYISPDSGLESQAEELASYGRHGDTMMMHVNPAELEALDRQGLLSINPETGQAEAFWPLVIGLIAGGLIGGATDDWSAEGIIGGAALGGLTGGLGGALFGGAAAPVAGAVAPAAASGPAIGVGTSLASTTAIPAGGSLAGLGGITWGAPTAAGMAPATGFIGPTAAGGAGSSVGGLGLTGSQAKGLAQGLSSIQGTMGGQGEESSRPPIQSPPVGEPQAEERRPLNVRKPVRRSGLGMRKDSRGRIGNVLG